MDTLESYLDRVCRGIAGPRSLRTHIRQELREHLKDAAAEHVAAGLSEEEALARALEEFGGPEEVRAELEAAHGQRFLMVVIDKAMAWKEKTMKARWIWSTWAHGMLLLVIAMEIVFIAGAMIFVVPKFREISKVGFPHRSTPGGEVVTWGVNFLGGLAGVFEYAIWIFIAVGIAWAAFEYFVRGENKTLIRLTQLTTAAAVLLVVACLTSAALVLPMIIEFPDLQNMTPAQAFTNAQLRLESDNVLLAQDGRRGDSRTMAQHALDASHMLGRLVDAAAMIEDAAPGGAGGLRKNYDRAREAVEEVRRAASDGDPSRMDAAVKEYQAIYATIGAAASQPATQAR